MVSLLKSRWAWALALAVGLLSVILWYLATRQPPPRDRRTKRVLAGATKVEVFRTDGMSFPYDKTSSKPGETRLGGFLVTSQGRDQGKEFADRLASVLFAKETTSQLWAACFWPGVAFRVWKDREAVDVLICFTCGNIYCGPPNNRGMENISFHGSPSRADLVRLAKEAFPDDKEIQELKEHW